MSDNKHINIDGLKIHYFESGSAKNTIVFIHGNSQSSDIWHNQFNNDELKNYRLIAFDLPGHGDSDHSKNPEHDYSLQGLAEIIQKAIEQLNLESFIVVALSLGSNLIGEMMEPLKNNEGFFLVSPDIIGEGVSIQDIFLPFKYTSILFSQSAIDEDLNEYLNETVLKEKERGLILSNYLKTDGLLRTTLAASIAAGKWSDEIQNINNASKPVALLFGKQDVLLNINYLNNISLNKWNNKSFVIEKAGHLPNLDQSELFNSLLSDFCNDCFK